MTSKTLSLKDKGKTQSLQDVWLSILDDLIVPKVLRSENRNGWGKPHALHNLPARQLHADPLKRVLFWFLLVLIRKKKGGGRIDNQRPNKTKQGNRVNTPTFRNIA
jgi:hypothetical protein